MTKFFCGVDVPHVCVFNYVSLRSGFRVVMSVTISAYKLCSVRITL